MALWDMLGRDTAGVIVGGSEVFLGPWTTNGGAASPLTSCGYTRGDSVFTPNMEVTDIESEQTVSPVLTFVSGAKFQWEFELLQNNLQNLRVALSQAQGQIAGAANGTILAFGEPVLEYFQMKIVTAGPGTGTTHAGTKIDTYLLWNVLLRMNGGLAFGKKSPQSIKMIASILPDSSIVETDPVTKGIYGNRTLA